MTVVETRGWHQWIAVRCCCQPQKVLGFVRLPERHCRPGTVRLPVRSKVYAGPRSESDYPTDVLVELRSISQSKSTLGDTDTRYLEHEIAVYSDDRPLEFWRDVAGFVEAAA